MAAAIKVPVLDADLLFRRWFFLSYPIRSAPEPSSRSALRELCRRFGWQLVSRIYFIGCTVKFIVTLLLDGQGTNPWLYYLGDFCSHLGGPKHMFIMPISLINLLVSLVYVLMETAARKSRAWRLPILIISAHPVPVLPKRETSASEGSAEPVKKPLKMIQLRKLAKVRPAMKRSDTRSSPKNWVHLKAMGPMKSPISEQSRVVSRATLFRSRTDSESESGLTSKTRARKPDNGEPDPYSDPLESFRRVVGNLDATRFRLHCVSLFRTCRFFCLAFMTVSLVAMSTVYFVWWPATYHLVGLVWLAPSLYYTYLSITCPCSLICLYYCTCYYCWLRLKNIQRSILRMILFADESSAVAAGFSAGISARRLNGLVRRMVANVNSYTAYVREANALWQWIIFLQIVLNTVVLDILLYLAIFVVRGDNPLVLTIIIMLCGLTGGAVLIFMSGASYIHHKIKRIRYDLYKLYWHGAGSMSVRVRLEVASAVEYMSQGHIGFTGYTIFHISFQTSIFIAIETALNFLLIVDVI